MSLPSEGEGTGAYAVTLGSGGHRRQHRQVLAAPGYGYQAPFTGYAAPRCSI